MPESFDRWLTRKMAARGLIQSQVAVFIGRNPGTVNRWLKGKALPDVDSCAKLAELFHESLDSVLKLAGHDVPVVEATASEEAREASQIVSDAPADLRPVLVEALRDITRQWQRPVFREQARAYLLGEERRAIQG